MLNKKGWVLLLSLIISSALAVCFAYVKNKSSVDNLAEIDIYKAVGFKVPGSLNSTTSGITGWYDEEYHWYYDVYLPWDEEESLEVVCDDAVTVTIEDVPYHNGDIISVPALQLLEGDIDIEGVDHLPGKFRFIGLKDVPTVYLGLYEENKEFLTSEKGNTATGFCTVLDENGSKDLMSNCSVRVHGNTSWGNEKKSYQFNLDTESGILGMSSQKNWLLISEYVDTSFMKDAIIYTLSKELGDQYTPDFRFVNVFLDGQYEGLYLLAQKIDIGEGTIDINDLEEINSVLQKDSLDNEYTGGYLVELADYEVTMQAEENLRIETPHRWMKVKSPSNITDKQYSYLSGLVNEAEEALYLPDGVTNSQGRIWSDYFDPESWICQYLIQEISVNLDTEYASESFYVDKDDIKLYGGPAWDFDRSINNYVGFIENERFNYPVRSVHNNAVHLYKDGSDGVLWLEALDSHEDFHNEMKQTYLESAKPVLDKILTEDVPMWRELIAHSVSNNYFRYNREEGLSGDREGFINRFNDSVATITDGFGKRADFLREYYSNEDDYNMLTFVIGDFRLSMMVPVKKGQTIGEDALPMYRGSMEWYYGDELFTTDTVVEEDMVLVQKNEPQ